MPALPHTPPIAPPESDAGPRRSLVLAGGGMRVAYQAGVVQALHDAGLGFSHADGTSGGIINLAMLLSGQSPEEMSERWRTLRVKDFVSFMPLTEYLKGPHIMALGDADGIVGKVFPHLGIDVGKIREARGMQGTFNVCNYTDKINEVIEHQKVDLDLLVAGISLPIFMPPVRRGEVMYVDSVWIRDANLIEAVRRGSEELWLVWCIGNTGEYRAGPFPQYVHMIELSANGSLYEDLERIEEINQRIRAGETIPGHDRPIRLHVIKPEHPLPLDPHLYAGRIDAETLIGMGYRDAGAYLDRMDDAGVPLAVGATRMRDPKRAILFQETMTGPFALGANDPGAGAERGAAEGTSLELHAGIEIQDLDRFIDDPEHAGAISGHVSFPGLGERMPGRGGVFNLFSPGDDPRVKLMIYELAFRHEGHPFYMAGHKKVTDEPGFDMWADTTTLYATLHRGTEKTDPVVGAGILRIDIGEMKRMLSTLHAPNAHGLIDATKTTAQFGKFFLGQLWDTYGLG